MVNNKFFLGSIVSFLFLVSFVHAFGIGANWADDAPLSLYPGQTFDFGFYINNQGVGTETNAKMELSSVDNIATLLDPKEIYTAAPNENHPVMVRVVIPSDAPIGTTTYRVTANFIEIIPPSPTENSGMIRMGVGVTRYVPIIIKTKDEVLGIQPPVVEPTLPKKEFPWLMITGIAVLIILILAYFIWKKMKSKPSEPQAQQPVAPVVSQQQATTITKETKK